MFCVTSRLARSVSTKTLDRHLLHLPCSPRLLPSFHGQGQSDPMGQGMMRTVGSDVRPVRKRVRSREGGTLWPNLIILTTCSWRMYVMFNLPQHRGTLTLPPCLQILAAISYHFGESLVRTRFTEYSTRFIRMAARYEEEYLGSTSIGYPSSSFEFPSTNESGGRLGSGLSFMDETSGGRELLANASRIEGWRQTKSFEYYKTVCSLIVDPHSYR